MLRAALEPSNCSEIRILSLVFDVISQIFIFANTLELEVSFAIEK